MPLTTIEDDATAVRHAYDALAGAYDVLAADYPHERWLTQIVDLAKREGVRGKRVLDLACGTGLSFMPLMRRTACDVSPEMVSLAQAACAGAADVFCADMRLVGQVGEFDLITCLDDAMNYLLDGSTSATSWRA